MITKKERALLVAEKVHFGVSYDIYPYMYHIRHTQSIAEELGYDENIVIACILHDSLEDTSLSYNDIKKAFGVEIADIVYAVTDEMGKDRYEKKIKTYPKIRDNWKATVVKLCDRIANIQHSKVYNDKMYQMYKAEHPTFVKSLKNPDHPADTYSAWKMLEDIMGV